MSPPLAATPPRARRSLLRRVAPFAVTFAVLVGVGVLAYLYFVRRGSCGPDSGTPCPVVEPALRDVGVLDGRALPEARLAPTAQRAAPDPVRAPAVEVIDPNFTLL